MSSVARTGRARRAPSDGQYADAVRILLAIAGALFSIVGLVLVYGGLMSPFAGSAFWALTGTGFVVSGALVARRHRAGLLTFAAVFAATLAWSLRNAGIGSPLPIRLIGPILLLALLALLLPVLCNWRPRHAAGAFALLGLATIGLGAAATAGGPLERPAASLTQFLDSKAKGVLQ